LKLPDGREVTAVVPPLPRSFTIAGQHPRLESERLDHLAYRYLGDATQFWVLCDAGNVMSPDALARRDRIAIPKRST
jgi:hypothetical protein